jgi:hypothetical protein
VVFWLSGVKRSSRTSWKKGLRKHDGRITICERVLRPLRKNHLAYMSVACTPQLYSSAKAVNSTASFLFAVVSILSLSFFFLAVAPSVPR